MNTYNLPEDLAIELNSLTLDDDQRKKIELALAKENYILAGSELINSGGYKLTKETGLPLYVKPSENDLRRFRERWQREDLGHKIILYGHSLSGHKCS